MELMEVLKTRRSVRKYTEEKVTKEQVQKLMEAAVMAPNGMKLENWAFGVVQDPGKMKKHSNGARIDFLGMLDKIPPLERYRETLSNPEYDMFYGATSLVVIYKHASDPVGEINCSLAAENLMLAARDMGLGTCWIGFATNYFSLPEVKKGLGVPEEYIAVAPIVVGYTAGELAPVDRKPPVVLFWE